MHRMDRHTRSPDQFGNNNRRRGQQGVNNKNNGRRRDNRQRSRSWSRSRSRERSHDRRRHEYSRSRSRDRGQMYGRGGGRGSSSEMYHDNGDDGHSKNHNNHHHDRYNDRRGGRDNDRRSSSRRDRYPSRRERSHDSFQDDLNSNDSFDSDQINSAEHYASGEPSHKILIHGLTTSVTESDIRNDLNNYGLHPTLRLIRKKGTCFAFADFSTQEEATRWMDFKQGVLTIDENNRGIMQYSRYHVRDKITTDWYCAKCGVLNFKRRYSCYKCHASRKESEKGGEGSDEISHILTKKILLRNLDVLTNEEGVLTLMQEVVPEQVSKISKILICRDPLTSTSRGICYLTFDNLVDSMNMFNALNAIDPPLTIGNREVIVTYCVDGAPNPPQNEYFDQNPRGGGPSENNSSKGRRNKPYGNHHNQQQSNDHYNSGSAAGKDSANTSHQYTLADVPRLAEYSANVYASNAAEKEHFYKYYTDYYINEINKGNLAGLPTINQIGETANSGAAVALSAIQRQQKLQHRDMSTAVTTSQSSSLTSPTTSSLPNGRDNKKYPTPDTSLYQYDDKSGFFYDPISGLYYDPNSLYYYNNVTCEYMYWSAEQSTYILAEQTDATTSQSAAAASLDRNPDSVQEERKDKSKSTAAPHDKVKVAKKIVKDMEKWAKQLNQKKDMFNVPQMATPVEEPPAPTSSGAAVHGKSANLRSSGYADVGFSILENKERPTVEPSKPLVRHHMHSESSSHGVSNQITTFESDSDNETSSKVSAESSYVAFDKLTCLLCKRAFPSADVLQKHLRMSQLHKENLIKHNLSKCGATESAAAAAAAAAAAEAAAYRDRAKERRLKYGESDPPPVNVSRERWANEMVKQSAAVQQSQESKTVAAMPIGESNVGNRLLQKMGWSEGQGLGRKNQGRTNIIEAESRAPTAGLGTKSTAFVPGDDYKTYVKRMMKARYDQED